MSTEILPAEVPQSQSSLSILRPIASPKDLLEYHAEVSQLVTKALKEDVDFGVIPGTGKKPTLLKPGAERLCLAFGAAPTYECVEHEIDHNRVVDWTKRKKVWNNKFRGDRTFTWEEENGTSLGLYRYVYKCKIVRDGRILAEGVGTCSTLESKYIDRPRDCENTVCKMAQKRAFVAATLHAFGLSDRFTQDVEDAPEVFGGRVDEPPYDNGAPPYGDSAPQHTAQQAPVDTTPPAQRTGATAKSEPAAEVPRTPSIYEGTANQAATLSNILKREKIPEIHWQEIGDRLMGKPSTELHKIIEPFRPKGGAK